MNGAGDFACRNVRAALGLERAGVAVVLSGAIADRAVLRDALARRGERAAIFSQLLTSGTDIEVAFASPATPPCGTGRSSTGRTGWPVSRSSTKTNPCFVPWM